MPTVRDLLGRKRARGGLGAGNDVVSASPDDTVLAAAQLMTARGIGGLIVKRATRSPASSPSATSCAASSAASATRPPRPCAR
jgi:hypothetical protein